MQTYPIAMNEWMGCFDNEDEAKCQITKTLNLNDEAKWKDRSSNFLLRLISYDENGYRTKEDEPKPRVRLALAFVQRMAENSDFDSFLRATFDAHGQDTEREKAESVSKNDTEPTDQPANSEIMNEEEQTEESTKSVDDKLATNAHENAGFSMDQSDDSEIKPTDSKGQEREKDSWNIQSSPSQSVTGKGIPPVDLCIQRAAEDAPQKKRRNGIIHQVAESGLCVALEKFLNKSNVNARNNIGETALHLAAEFENPDDVKVLLRNGATFKVCVVICDIAVLVLELKVRK